MRERTLLFSALDVFCSSVKGGVYHLAGTRRVALRRQLFVEAGEQHVNQLQGVQALAKQPNGLGIRDAIFELQVQKAHEGEPVAYLILDALVGQVVQLLQHQHLEHEHDINRLGARVALTCLLVHPIQVGAERFPVDLVFQTNQRVAHPGERGGAFRYVKKAWLPLTFRRVCSRGFHGRNGIR